MFDADDSISPNGSELLNDPWVEIIKIEVNGTSLDLDSLQKDGLGYVISGLKAEDTVTLYSDSGYNRVEVQNYDEGSGDKDGFSIHKFSYGVLGSGDSIDMTFDVTLQDGDGDSSTGQIDLSVSPEGLILNGTAINESLIGGSGDDVFHGNGGDDIMTGGTGSDSFLYDSTDLDHGYDQILDFEHGSGGDTLDFIDIFGDSGKSSTQLVSEQYLNFTTDNVANTVSLEIDDNGATAGGNQVTIEMHVSDFDNGNDVINSMLDNNIKVIG